MTDSPAADEIGYRVSPAVNADALNALFAAAWPAHETRDFAELRHGLAYVCAYAGERLVGFVNVAWDGNTHAFILDTTVHPEHQRRGIGARLVERAVAAADARHVRWVHVDYEPHLHGFYQKCGFRPTMAGLRRLGPLAGRPSMG